MLLPTSRRFFLSWYHKPLGEMGQFLGSFVINRVLTTDWIQWLSQSRYSPPETRMKVKPGSRHPVMFDQLKQGQNFSEPDSKQKTEPINFYTNVAGKYQTNLAWSIHLPTFFIPSILIPCHLRQTPTFSVINIFDHAYFYQLIFIEMSLENIK